jgi:hypothetical protein
MRQSLARTLFLLLVLANAAFYAYAYVARERDTAQRAGPGLQLNADRVRIVRPGVSNAAAVAPAACLEWGGLAGPEVARASAALAQLALPESRIQRAVTDTGGYWVYMPPQKTPEALNKKLQELKALGVTDTHVVQEPAQWRTAISFGIFKTEEAAASFLEGLKAKGVRTAVTGRRENLLKHVVFFVREPAPEIVAKMAELQQAFPGSQIKAGQCPPP